MADVATAANARDVGPVVPRPLEDLSREAPAIPQTVVRPAGASSTVGGRPLP